jgi:hypothetical protein
MCHPTSRLRRERMLAHIQSETGEGQPRRRALSADEFRADVLRSSPRAAVAGGQLLAMIQLHAAGQRPSFNQALPLVAALLPKWEQPLAPYWSKDCHVGHHPHDRKNMLSAYKEYRSVVHFWAAALHGQQHGLEDIWPASLRTLPIFLAYANAILELACRLPSVVPGQRAAMSRSTAWRFSAHDIQSVTLVGVPIVPASDLRRAPKS